MDEGTMGATEGEYWFASSDEERARLIRQGEASRPATESLFRAAGISPGARVLDCGSGAGDVSFVAAEIVTAAGGVVGIDRDAEQVLAATRRARDLRLSHVRFETGDVSAPPDGPFDAVVGRLVLMYLSDPAAVLRVLADRLAHGGVMAFLEASFTRSYEPALWPPSPLADRLNEWAHLALKISKIQLLMGVRLPSLFRSVGLQPQPPYQGTDLIYTGDAALEQICTMTRSRLPLFIKHGIATEQEVDIDTLEDRLRAECGNDAVLSMPGLLGVWARKP
jgi:SAM-dependent methyltransferase